MAKKTSNVSFRIDSDLKAQADSLFSQLGLNMTTAFNIKLKINEKNHYNNLPNNHFFRRQIAV